MRNGQVEETAKINSLKKELKLKEFQFNSIFEFSESIYSSFNLDSVVRIFFSTLMGQLGVSRAFIYDSGNKLFRKRGFKSSEPEIEAFYKSLKKLGNHWLYLKTEDLKPTAKNIREYLLKEKIFYLVNVSQSEKKIGILGLGQKFNRKELTQENLEYAFFVSKFALSAMENAILINNLIESKRVEREIQIARDIQLSLLPQSVPQLKNFEIHVIYRPISDVGGDYYDILKEHMGALPILIADVEGKGLSAALLAASSQAILHSLNELYFFEPGKFISKANSLIYDFTKGQRFITLCWMLVEDEKKSITYVNAGHVPPIVISKSRNCVTRLSTGGFLTGFIGEVEYEKETINLEPGDIIAVFTDGVPEVANRDDRDYGEEAMVDFIKKNSHLSAAQLTEGLLNEMVIFSEGKSFRDDFTLIILKVK